VIYINHNNMNGDHHDRGPQYTVYSIACNHNIFHRWPVSLRKKLSSSAFNPTSGVRFVKIKTVLASLCTSAYLCRLQINKIPTIQVLYIILCVSNSLIVSGMTKLFTCFPWIMGKFAFYNNI